jgi:radical SAM superfamily enzyme YgiQ (UPF0313 family)
MATHSNQEMEATIRKALSLRCGRVDVFFMIGLPGQTRDSVMQTIDYCGHLFRVSDRRLSCFISPMGPFLDPGSRGFEAPEQHGYHLLARTLEEHRQLLVQPSWKQILNYETEWMSREEMAAVTYDAAEALNALKLAYGRIDRARAEEVARRIADARALRSRLEAGERDGVPDPDALTQLRGEIRAYSDSTVCDKRELFWSNRRLNFHLWGVLRAALGLT